MKASLEKLVAQFSQQKQHFSTPCYVYSLEDIADNYRKLKDRLGTSLIYSLKANSCLDLIVRSGHVFEDGIEIASVGELNLLPRGESPRYINNPSADKSFIRAAIASKCTLVVDNLSQLEIIREFQGKRPINPLILRLNPSTLDQFDKAQTVTKKDHFGFGWSDVEIALAFCKEHDLKIGGFHVFRGSYNFAKLAYSTAQAALQIVEKFERELGYAITLVNLGGGFDLNWESVDFNFEQYRELLGEFPSHIKITHESGRAIVASAGYFVTQVRYVKSIEGQQYGICDGGMAQNFLLAKTESTFKRFSQPLILREGKVLEPVSNAEGCLLVGTSCNKEDVIGEVKGAAIQPGDLAIFSNCGAYNASYTVAPFLSLPSAKSYLME
ncbi:PLP-dependent decarboxylase [Microbulbifer sp. THAF38]|uniref:PLP-dependent decarboxylase n=1 Tax=Microbulbifer sp. THAF38 TaxID=2587856 RepID=UPI00126951E0|nr:PLP-dependent decarboxylase [Microbulbifer sp. THAF38]QFT55282.1 L-glutamyl-[BtrI acyl-carrier protein] decarboxylase [Microbulbifer sp. THAF38]